MRSPVFRLLATTGPLEEKSPTAASVRIFAICCSHTRSSSRHWSTVRKTRSGWPRSFFPASTRAGRRLFQAWRPRPRMRSATTIGRETARELRARLLRAVEAAAGEMVLSSDLFPECIAVDGIPSPRRGAGCRGTGADRRGARADARAGRRGGPAPAHLAHDAVGKDAEIWTLAPSDVRKSERPKNRRKLKGLPHCRKARSSVAQRRFGLVRYSHKKSQGGPEP